MAWEGTPKVCCTECNGQVYQCWVCKALLCVWLTVLLCKLSAVPIQGVKPSQGECGELDPLPLPPRKSFVPLVCKALLAEADSAAPGEHSMSLNAFAPSLFLQTALAGRTVPRFIF